MLIYKATNKVNGKIYIGLTVKSLKIRIDRHRSYAKVKTRTYRSKFYNAWRKYGETAFEWEVIEEHNKNNDIGRDSN